MPERIRLSRAKGWRLPENTVKVDRSTGYGNPWYVGPGRVRLHSGHVVNIGPFLTAEGAVDRFRRWMKRHGVPCPRCAEVRPRAQPSILLPEQRCKVDGYRDSRPRTYETEYMHPRPEEPNP